MLNNCENDWPFVLTFLNNLIPFFNKALEGWYYWPYVIPNDVMIHIFFPMLVIIYHKNKVIFWILNLILLLFGFGINAYITLKHSLRVGVLTFENHFLFAYLLNKPYTKFPAVVLGASMGVFYLNWWKYQKSDVRTRSEKFIILNCIHKSKCLWILLYIYSIITMIAVVALPFFANLNGYAWAMVSNAIFFAVSRFFYITSIMAIIIAILIGRGKILKSLLSIYFFTPLSKLTFVVYLIFPLIIGAGYFDTSGDISASFTKAIMSMISNTILCYLFAFFLYLIWQKPIANLWNLIYFYWIKDNKSKGLKEMNSGKKDE